MAVLPIRIYPDPVLREAAAPVGEVDADVRKLIEDMRETMIAARGIGLAAPQVGIQRRVLVYQLSEEDEFHALIDPVITLRRGRATDDEGCLSIPGLSLPVERDAEVTVTARDAEGNETTYSAVELEARAIQHEIDHLDGVLFIQRLTPELRRQAKRAIREGAMTLPPLATPGL